MCFKDIKFEPKYYLIADVPGYFGENDIDKRGNKSDIKYIFNKNLDATFLIQIMEKNISKIKLNLKNKFIFLSHFNFLRGISIKKYFVVCRYTVGI